jgi:hypothetical protein
MIDIHPVAEKFPLLFGREYEELVEDIKDRGQLHPVVFHDNRLLDGRNRVRACTELGITPTEIEWDAPDGVTAGEWIVSTNLQRRHLTSQQRAMIAADPDILDILEAEARERQGTRMDLDNIQAKMPEGSQSRDEAAKTFQTSARYVQDAKKIRKQKPELVEPVINGTLSLKEAKKKVESAELDEVLKKINKDDRGVLSDLVNEAETNHTQKLSMAMHLAAMSQPERTRVKVLAQSSDEYDRDLAATTAAQLPPPIPADIKIVLAIRSVATQRRNGLAKLDPKHRWLPELDTIIERLTNLMES